MPTSTGRDKEKAPTSNNEATKNIVAFYIGPLLLKIFCVMSLVGVRK